MDEMTFPTRIDPTRNIDRFYVVQVMPSLFGDWTVLRECGAGAGCASVGPARLPGHRVAQQLPATAMKPRPRSIARSSAGCSGVTHYLSCPPACGSIMKANYSLAQTEWQDHEKRHPGRREVKNIGDQRHDDQVNGEPSKSWPLLLRRSKVRRPCSRYQEL
jgi:hypothetical protein